MALAEDMLWICMWEQGSERAKALLDSNARKQECVFEVELVNGVFQSIYTKPSEEVMMNSLQILSSKTQHPLNTMPTTSPLFSGAPISARAGKVLRLVIISLSIYCLYPHQCFPRVRATQCLIKQFWLYICDVARQASLYPGH